MVHPKKKLLLSSKQLHLLIFTILLLLMCLLMPCINALSFNFSSFKFNQKSIKREGAADFNGTSISLNKPLNSSVGRALYHEPMQLWDANGNLADFTSHFSFKISKVDGNDSGHGLTFVLVKENDVLSPTSLGRLLGLFASEESGLSGNVENQVVAVEFDTHKNKEWENTDNHIGIDVNSLKSKSYTNVTVGFIDQGIASVWIVYNSTTKMLSASLTFTEKSTYYDVSYEVDLRAYLPQRVQVGFTGATEKLVESHDIYSWSFSSSLESATGPPTPALGSPTPPPGGNKVALVVGVTSGLFMVVLIIGAALYCRFRSKRNIVARTPLVESPLVPPQSPHIQYSGPKRFSYLELTKATNNFDEELKLGKGGFGDVYRGKLAGSNEEVAVKRFRSGSSQGEKEYVSEVNVISMLKHKNLVHFKGWCHEDGELILVYEFMFNRSLDFHLFSRYLAPLTWATRYKIVVDLASALHYLQEGCDPFVLHRDIKSSNIMLDAKFNAKLGDFGLARLTYQDQKFKTTIPAGTLGYLAPEVLSNQKVSKASDTYSFGVVALEVASGQRPVGQRREDPKNVVNLVEWVWELYGQNSILDAVDTRLNGEFNHDQARRLVMVGLWCCHPDPGNRPSIRQVQAVLNSEATEPSLPLSLPKPTYVSSNTSRDMTEAGSSTRESHTTSSNNISA